MYSLFLINFFKLIREGFKKKIKKKVENSILGGGGQRGSFSTFLFFYFFCFKWPKNQFQTLKFFSCRGGGPPLGHLKPPLGSMDTYIADKIISWPNLHVSRPSLCMLRPTLRVTWQNLAKNFLALRQFYYFLKIFSKFFGIFNGENTLFSKSAQKMVQFQKKILYIFSTSRGGGVRTQSGIFHFFFKFFF